MEYGGDLQDLGHGSLKIGGSALKDGRDLNLNPAIWETIAGTGCTSICSATGQAKIHRADGHDESLFEPGGGRVASNERKENCEGCRRYKTEVVVLFL